MADLSFLHILGMLFAVTLIILASIYAGQKVKCVADFDSGSRSAGPAVVAGAILGTLVGGSSTIGTAQLAFHFGFSAWWFTLGGGIACAVLGLIWVHPLRRTNCPTLVSIITQAYGHRIGVTASLLSSVGTFINILAQLLSAAAVIAIILPDLRFVYSLILSAALMAIYVIFGGVLSAGLVGIVKLILLIISVFYGSFLVLRLTGGVSTFYNTLDHATYFNLFARGFSTDAGSGLSLLLGVLSTQSYAQALLAGRDDRAARTGAFISACISPLIGLGSILIGLYMRITYPGIEAQVAFPQFVLDQMPPLPAGLVLATLLITVTGTGAGLSLGIVTTLRTDIFKRLTCRLDHPRVSLMFSRAMILLVLAIACILCACPIGHTILNFSFMSMGLRGAVLLVPLCCAMWLPGLVDRRWILCSIVLSPALVMVFELLKILPFDPLFLGIAASAVLCGIGYTVRQAKL